MAETAAVFKDKVVKKFIKDMDKNSNAINGRKREYVSLLSAIVYGDIIKHFEQESGPEGTWKHWSFLYEMHMFKISKGGNKILQDTGRLKNGILPIKAGSNWKKNSSGILWYNKVKYAAVHNYGSKTMPKREFMYLSDKGLDDISKQTLAFVLDGKK